MTEQRVTALVQQIHDTPVKACLVITGAGTSAISTLFSVAGASRTVIDAQIPYSKAALTSYVGLQAEQHVSSDEAKAMAETAYDRAVQLSGPNGQGDQLVGLSCTAAIATNRMRRGENRAHIGWHDGKRGATYSIVMNKGERERAEEEKLCGAIVLNALADACGVAVRLELDLLDGEIVERVTH